MPNLKGMNVEALMNLRDQVDKRLLECRAELERQLTAIKPKGKRTGSLKGRKVPPKYRGPSGETWAGRGAKPTAIKGGKKLDDFLIDKSVGKGRKKRRSKR